MKRKFVIGTRGSALALWQTDFIKSRLKQHFPKTTFETLIIKTTGDAILDTALSKIGDKGLFTKQIETALLEQTIDLAIHSLKDLPTIQPEGLKIGAVSEREKPNDVFISKSFSSIGDLPQKAKVATGSLRRRSQLLNFRPDLEILEIRGNVPTRIEKFLATDIDGMILAFAGVHRLKLDLNIKEIVPTDILLPAVGQGAMAVEIRETDNEIFEMLRLINDSEVEICINAERAFLRSLEGGCQVPIGALATLNGDDLHLEGFVGSLNGKMNLREKIVGAKNDAENLGEFLADILIRKGANEILERTREKVENLEEKVI